MSVKRSSMIFLPDYVYDGLLGSGISLEEIANISSKNAEELMYKIFKVIPLPDLIDIELLNRNMYKTLYNISLDDIHTNVNGNIIIRRIYGIVSSQFEFCNKLDNLYYNKEMSDDSILMSDNNKCYTVKYERNTVFIIIHDGFTNFIINNNKEISKVLSKRLLDYCVKGLGKDNFDKSNLVDLAIKII